MFPPPVIPPVAAFLVVPSIMFAGSPVVVAASVGVGARAIMVGRTFVLALPLI